jgi:hypothetical protein
MRKSSQNFMCQHIAATLITLLTHIAAQMLKNDIRVLKKGWFQG